MRLAPLAALLVALPLAAQPAPADSARAVWLAPHVAPLDGLLADPASAAGGPFLDAVAGARVVALSEPTHGDGAAFLVRSALTRLLHERGGAETLALEASGLTEALPLTSPADALARIDSVAPYVWTTAREARAGLAYAASTAGSPRPLRVVGLDVTPQTGGAAAWDQVERALANAGALDGRWPEVRRVLGAYSRFQRPAVSDSLRDEIEGAVADYRAALSGAGAEEEGLVLGGFLAAAAQFWVQRSTPRDRQMGENVAYLARGSATPLVVWAASSHAVRRLAAVDNLDPAWSYDEAVTMGDAASAALGDGYRAVAFTACGGAWGAAPLDLPVEAIPPPSPGSLEALACAAPFETAAFLDLRALAQTEAGAWLNAPLLARPLGYTEMRAGWPLVLDGLVVIREMTPARATE
ncbi:erythromycin esterase family protein [Rubrivirga sp. S365]|uniref:Erythromycin esterase family protein n=1 Tax=Rubrivirga litoralis TaxID=3075598 RepID=A0ABU3BQT4_9BACT|nr:MULTISPECIES: erythromycin esterase family protein [unclassified Rubrivirga]MDT0631646.1 erythromycin esterase family protein [Rubrivirga sp. F394]MDT7855611.1 erythromycin esterase family protein [Rubrivirga sp. S365]